MDINVESEHWSSNDSHCSQWYWTKSRIGLSFVPWQWVVAVVVVVFGHLVQLPLALMIESFSLIFAQKIVASISLYREYQMDRIVSLSCKSERDPRIWKSFSRYQLPFATGTRVNEGEWNSTVIIEITAVADAVRWEFRSGWQIER